MCLECGIELVPMHALSRSGSAEEPDEWVLPEHQRRSPLAFDRGRGLLLALAVLGLALFFAPWVEIIMPESVRRSGFDLAHGRAGWLWGGVTGYFVLLPLIWTRSTIAALRGVRVAATLLALMTLSEVTLLFVLRPTSQGRAPFAIEWCWGIYASGLVSLVATITAIRLGGALPPLPSASPSDPPPDDRAERAHDQVLH